MGNNILLFESLFHTKISTENIQDYLQQVAEEFPYFSPAQFFLLNKLQPGTPEFNEQAAKTSVLFNNAHWLNFQLQETRDAINNRQHNEEPVAAVLIAQDVEDEPDNIENNPTEPGVGEDITHTEDIGNEAEEPVTVEITEEAGELVPTETEEHITEIPVTDDIPDQIPANSTDLSEPEATETDQELQIDIAHLEEIKTNEIIEEEENTIQESIATNEPEETEADHADNTDQTTNEQQDQQPLNFKLNLAQETTTEDTVTFEPLHTTDYFASLGIKLSNEIKPTDKLGKQLKSFTEWLKTMKKVHADQLGESSGQADQVIQTLADRSNTEDEVVTEAMAEVLLQQDKLTKAIEVYKKLSLLNPAKSAYFAAKIEQLKK